MSTKRRDMGLGSIFQYPGCKRWVIQYHVDGKRYREATGLTSKTEAQTKLMEKLISIGSGQFVEPERKRPVRIEELFDLIKDDYSSENRKSADDLEARWRLHLQPWFGKLPVQKLTTDRVKIYIRTRQEQGAARATVNRELAALRRMFNLGRQTNPPKVRVVPYIPLFKKENNIRKGFVEDTNYAKLTAEAGELWLRTFLELAYTYGWRRSEIFGLRVRHIDLPHRTIRLDPGTTKNDEGREVTMTAKVYDLLRASIVDKGSNDFVLTRPNGKPVKDFRTAWYHLCIKTGLGKFTCRTCLVPGTKELVDAVLKPWSEQDKRMNWLCPQCGARGEDALRYQGRIPHDLRRSAAKALRRAGVPESLIMKTGGWKTAEVFRRYAIDSTADQKLVVEAIERARAVPKTPGQAGSPNVALISSDSPEVEAPATRKAIQ